MRLIESEKVIDFVKYWMSREEVTDDKKPHCMSAQDTLKKVEDFVVDLNGIIANEKNTRTLAHWNFLSCDNEIDMVYNCSNCDENFYEEDFYSKFFEEKDKYKPYKFCPFCGAEMEL